MQPIGDVSSDPVRRRSDAPAPDDVSTAELEWLDFSTSERTVLDAFEGAFGRRDAAAALGLFNSAALPLPDALVQIDRLFELLVDRYDGRARPHFSVRIARSG
ncbi:hypothetical protein G8O24_29270 [Bradyrhizobium sp. INPA01-394B]|uniref:Uncharacterized protein n=1 Tax=Bradyrhizobium campsiandrae TaxID=1729892 RepID=A0ABR7U4Q9_9BRAD|nr:hypothetical protein [Bradyrhizobium campsiandrae]MBC9881420.1 hypothetical protein [Bradyrhizobium campsiandrae]MBC9979039.1 hypothetical protein [Bradyrhizobium campsiandrae]